MIMSSSEQLSEKPLVGEKLQGEQLVELVDARPHLLEEEILKFRHRLAETGLFTDENLIRMIDSHPREYCNVSRMGPDHSTYEWGEGHTDGLSGADLLEAIRKGRLWINIRRLMRFQPEMHAIVERLYGELEQKCPGFQTSKHSANLLISSPNALVYYHLDVPQNILWHIRGRKRAWVYPITEEVLPHDVLESTVAGERVEDLPYQPEFDQKAEVFDLEPGEVVTWPQNTPHRVENFDSFNVSLSTEHYTAQQIRHVRVCRVNRLLKRTGLSANSLKTNGIGYLLKSAVFFGHRSIQKLLTKDEVSYHYPKTFRVNPNAPNAVELYDNVTSTSGVMM